MAFGIYHSFVSAKADSGDATLLQPSNWNAALVLEDATSGGVLYASSTTAPACSALLAAGGLVVGGGAGAAPLTYANLTYTDASKLLNVGVAGTATGSVTIGEAASVNAFLSFGGTVSQVLYGRNNSPGITWQIVTDNTGSGGTSEFRFNSTGMLGWNSGTNLGAGSRDTSLSRISAGVLGLGTGAQGEIDGTLSLVGIELGHASDTTLSRSAAGVLAVEGVVIPSISSTNTLTNKRITKRTGTTTSHATPTINTDNVDMYFITAQAEAITSFTTNLSGTPTEGQSLLISITGTAARAITWGASFEASTSALPTTTVSTDRLDVAFIWNSVSSKWRCTGSA